MCQKRSVCNRCEGHSFPPTQQDQCRCLTPVHILLDKLAMVLFFTFLNSCLLFGLSWVTKECLHGEDFASCRMIPILMYNYNIEERALFFFPYVHCDNTIDDNNAVEL